MRRLWRLVSPLRFPPPQHGIPAASNSFSIAHSFTLARSFWKPAIYPFGSTFAQWPMTTPPHQIEQRRSFASKVKKYKIKCYSSFKERFREKANGEYKRWRAGKRHNAHSKTNKQLRQLRRPSVVYSAYAKVMKKLNFHG